MEQIGTQEVDEASTTMMLPERELGSSSPDAVPAWVRELFRCRRWIEAALAASPVRFLEFRDVFDAVLDKKAYLWPGQRSCHVVEVSQIGRRKVAIAWLAGGDINELLEMTPHIERWAADEMGCTAALVIGRRGWLKPLAGRGYVEAHTTLVKELA